MEEQASVRFRLTLKSAITAPSAIVIVPARMTIKPNFAFPKKPGTAVIRIPNTPTLVRMPESSADAGEGATGCAFGSQICSGNIPALAPKPSRMQIPAAKVIFG